MAARPGDDGTMKPWTLAVVLLGGSLAITALLWVLGYPFLFLLVFIPFLPLLGRHFGKRRCPVCGWEATGSERFCPQDATPLVAGKDPDEKNPDR